MNFLRYLPLLLLSSPEPEPLSVPHVTLSEADQEALDDLLSHFVAQSVVASPRGLPLADFDLSNATAPTIWRLMRLNLVGSSKDADGVVCYHLTPLGWSLQQPCIEAVNAACLDAFRKTQPAPLTGPEQRAQQAAVDDVKRRLAALHRYALRCAHDFPITAEVAV